MTIASLVEMHLFDGLDLCYKGKLVRKPVKKQRTRNQCYKDFTGLYSQVCKHRPIFKVNYSPTCCQIRYVDARFHF